MSSNCNLGDCQWRIKGVQMHPSLAAISKVKVTYVYRTAVLDLFRFLSPALDKSP